MAGGILLRLRCRPRPARHSGTNSNDYTEFDFWFSWRQRMKTLQRYGRHRLVHPGTFLLWGVQIEVGSVATPLEKPDPGRIWIKCRRFYQAYRDLIFTGSNGVVSTPAMGVAPLYPPM